MSDLRSGKLWRQSAGICALTLWARVLCAAAPDGDGSVSVSGELKQWHKITLTVDGPSASERDPGFNPFTDGRLVVRFQHESGAPVYDVPGYFAADGRAADSGAESGTQWRAHLAPDKPGRWTYRVSFARGPLAAVTAGVEGVVKAPGDGRAGEFTVAPTDKTGRDFRARGRLEYVGMHHLRFAGSGEYFLKAGADAPENLLGYADFDGTRSARPAGTARSGEAATVKLKTWEPHARDWQPGDPQWREGRGRGLIGALNYLSGKGCNGFSFLTYNAGGDGDDVWPFVERGEQLRYDCSKLDQWQRVFDHATARGLHLHFKMQETENDDMKGPGAAQALDGGDLGPARKLYIRELVARFAHELALNWNLGEENTQSFEQQRAMGRFLAQTDPYHHPVVLHTYPDWQERVYTNHLGSNSVLSGLSLQNSWSAAHERTLRWVEASRKAGKPWVVANDEQNPAEMGVPPDPGYAGHSGQALQNGRPYDLHDIRKFCLWGNLMAGGAGVEYYFGYKLPQNDLQCQDWRSRDRSWDYCRIALEFFRENRVPFWEMRNADARVDGEPGQAPRYCLAKPGECYLVYLPRGGAAGLDVGGLSGSWSVRWFNPRAGGALVTGQTKTVNGPGRVALGPPPADATQDWLVIVRKEGMN